MSKLSDWGVPAGLVLLSVVPILAGSVRMAQIASGVMTPEKCAMVKQSGAGGFAYCCCDPVQFAGRIAICATVAAWFSALA